MTRSYLGLGSNVQPDHFLPVGLEALRRSFGTLRLSPVYEGAAIGFRGAPFWNLVACVDVDVSVGRLQSLLRDIEYAHGRSSQTARNSPRTLDIDILTFGDAVGVIDGVDLPRGEILQHAFVLRPLAELAPRERHPVSGVTYGQLWREFDQQSQPLTAVTL